jgi:hypothetical protein
MLGDNGISVAVAVDMSCNTTVQTMKSQSHVMVSAGD